MSRFQEMQTFAFGRVVGAAYCIQGMKRNSNKDGFLALPNGLFAVADGMGAKPGAFEAMELALTTLEDICVSRRPNREQLDTALNAANRSVLALRRKLPKASSPATVIVIIWLNVHDTPADYLVAHVGDARGHVVTSDGTLLQLTQDHKEDASRPNAPTRGIGMDHWNKVPNVAEIEKGTLEPGAGILLSSDGVHGRESLADDKIRKNLRDLREDPERLTWLLKGNLGMRADDNTLLYAHLTEPDDDTEDLEDPATDAYKTIEELLEVES